MPILWVFETNVFVVQKGLFAIQNVGNRFFYDLFSRSMTWEYTGLQGVTGSYKGLQGGYEGLQSVTGDDKGLQGVIKYYRNFFLTRTFPHTFFWSLLHKNQR